MEQIEKIFIFMIFSAQFVAPKDFKRKDWFISTNNLWYYHAPENPTEKTKTKILLKTIDPFLRKIFALCASKRLKTYPSCQGHFYGKVKFKKIWNHLLEDKEKFRSGIVLTNIETNKKLFHINTGYELPWGSFEEFYSSVKDKSQQGYFAFQLDESITLTLPKNFQNDKVQLIFNKKESLVEINVFGKNRDEQQKLWDLVFEFLKKTL